MSTYRQVLSEEMEPVVLVLRFRADVIRRNRNSEPRLMWKQGKRKGRFFRLKVEGTFSWPCYALNSITDLTALQEKFDKD